MDELPTRFAGEVAEIMNDLNEDLGSALAELDPVLHNKFRELIVESFARCEGNVTKVVDELATQNLWMIFVGREHSARGYSSPLGRHDDNVPSFIPDDLSGL